MEKLQLSFISASNERIARLLDGTVDVEGIDLMWTNSDPSETFWRQLKFEEFEVCEMSFSSLLIALANGADMVRVHDVREMARVARMSDAIVRGWKQP